MIPKKVTMPRAEKPKVFHRDFLGAHRYTTRGGTARPAGGVLRTAVVCRGQPRGDTTSPLRCLRTYPYVYFVLGKALKSRASPGAKSVLSVRPCFGMAWIMPEMCRKFIKQRTLITRILSQMMILILPNSSLQVQRLPSPQVPRLVVHRITNHGIR